MSSCKTGDMFNTIYKSGISNAIWYIVNDAHKNQKYGGKDYIKAHIEPVTISALEIQSQDFPHVDSEDVFIVAALHDAIEDGPDFILDEITGVLAMYGKDYLLSTILWLTKEEGEEYNSYIDSLLSSGDLIAIIVKCADMRLNSMNSNFKKKKYVDNLPKIEDYLHMVK